MGLSRNKVAVGEPAAGSPPFYGRLDFGPGKPGPSYGRLPYCPRPSSFSPARPDGAPGGSLTASPPATTLGTRGGRSPPHRGRDTFFDIGTGVPEREPSEDTRSRAPNAARESGEDNEVRCAKAHRPRSPNSVVKLVRVCGGCSGAERRRRTWAAAISLGEVLPTFDPGISECGNAARVDSARSGR